MSILKDFYDRLSFREKAIVQLACEIYESGNLSVEEAFQKASDELKAADKFAAKEKSGLEAMEGIA